MAKIYKSILSLLLICLLNGCGNDENEPIIEPDNPEQPVPDSPDDPSDSDEIVSPDYVAIDWDKAKIQSMNIDEGEFSLVFDNGEIPAFRDSFSIVVLQTDTSAYLRRVMHTQINDNMATLKTIDAKMEELFRDIEFTLSIGEGTQTRLITSLGNVYAPSKIVQIYEDNSYNILYDETNTRSNYTEIDPSAPIPLFYIDKSNTSLNADFGELATNISLDAEKYLHSLTNTISLHFKFSPAVYEKEITENFRVKMSEVEEFSCKTDLDFTSQTKLKVSVAKGYNVKDEVNLLKPLYNFYTFLVGPVPVFFTQSVGLQAAYEFGIEEKISAGFGYGINGGFSMGLEYKKGEGIKPIGDHRFSSEMYPLKFQLNSPSIYGKLSICPELSFKLYGGIGPFFRIVPYIENRLYTGHILPQFYGWSNQLQSGVDLQIGGKIEFFESDIFKAEISHVFHVANKEIYRAPKYIRLLTSEDDAKVEINQPVKVDFEVTSGFSLFFDEEETEESVEMALVHFKGTGSSKVSQQYVLTDASGIAEVEWTPTEAKDSLIAVILDQDGTELSKAFFSPNIQKEFSIVGRWWDSSKWMLPQPVRHPEREDSENYLEFFADGTFEECYNPLQKIRGVDIVSDKDYEKYKYATVLSWSLGRGTYSYFNNELKTHITYQHEIRNCTAYDAMGNIVYPYCSYREFVSPPIDHRFNIEKIKIIDENCIYLLRNETWEDYHRITEDFKPELLYVTSVAE